MSAAPDTREVVLKRIKARRLQIKKYVDKTEPRGARLTTLSIVCGALATVLTAAPAIGGQNLTDALGAAGSSTTWRILCGLAAACSLIATVATNLYKSNEIATRLTKANKCDLKLEGLELAVETDQLPDVQAISRFDECMEMIDFPMPETEAQAPHSSGLDSVTGGISEPSSNQVVEDTFSCSGWSKGLQPGLRLWLAVELPGKIWPKEGGVPVAKDGSWKKTVFEDGMAERFSLALYAADAEGDSYIRAWFEKCKRTGSYPELQSLPGTIRLQRISGLTRTQG